MTTSALPTPAGPAAAMRPARTAAQPGRERERPARTGVSGADPPALPADDELIARLLDGDERAFSAIVRAYSGSLLRLARAFVSSRAVAEEVVQDTWIAVMRGLPRFQRRSSLRTWIFRILSNRAKTRGVREGRTIPFTSLGDADEDGPTIEPVRYTFDGKWQQPPRDWDEDTPERLTLLAEVRRVVERAVEQLPSKQRAVMTLRDLELVESHETCNILGISETYQRVLLHRGRVRVREVLAAYLSGEADGDLPGGM